MRVFLIWSGESCAIALLLQKYFSCMIQGCDVTLSNRDQLDISWITEVVREGSGSIYGVICLTPGDLKCPWIVFEAGAISASSGGTVTCLLLGGLRPAEIAGPLAQFQALVFGKDEIRVLLGDINNQLATSLPFQQFDLIFEKWWPDLERECEGIEPRSLEECFIRTERDILEEALLRLRKIEGALGVRQSASPYRLHDFPFEPRIQQLWLRLERSWGRLTRGQKALLLDLVSSKSPGRVTDEASVIRKYPPVDFLALLHAGLIGSYEDGEVLVDAITVEFVESKIAALEQKHTGKT